ncbi:polysaccharide pyruvyl transferase family protein [Motiliproteus sediminis]|uniref:polysaccharide pyruvyl transferase family protein n=1 Tax=Motiliproteus sediminis TaxID=1468178 RepID=UPI001AEF36D7|nr:polysaccharide pyruvyl transferase family protein [Motiliproteus sediminis]
MKRIFHVGGWSRNYGDLALQNGVMAEFQKHAQNGLEFVPIHCQQTWFHPDLIELINRDADMLLLGGGGMVFHRPEDNSHSGWQFNIRTEDIDKIKVPIVVYGIGFNKFYYDDRGFKPQMGESLRRVQQAAAIFSVRNQGSREALAGFGLDADAIEVVPDPGMFVTPAKLTVPEFSGKHPLIGLNWAGDRPFYRFPEPWEAHRQSVIDSLCDALNRVIDEQPDGLVAFVPHLQENIDAEVYPLFKERLGDRIVNIEEICAQIYPPSAVQAGFLADIYRQMDCVIGMRGHANIIPFGVGTPIIGFGSHNKNRFFLNECGLSDYMIDTTQCDLSDSADQMHGTISRCLANRTEIQTHIRERKGQFSDITDDFIKRALGLIDA